MTGDIYLRKSRADAELEALGQGETLARHRAVLLELARQKNISIRRIHSEVVSGESIAARPVMRELLRDVEAGLCGCVLVMEVERLARGDTMDQGIVAKTFKYSGTLIVTPSKTYDPNDQFDEEYFEFGLFMSRREYKTINRRLQAGRLAASREGQFLGSVPPYGYTRLRLERPTRHTLAVEPCQAEVVRMIFDLYLGGSTGADGVCRPMGYGAIADRLNSQGVPTATGAGGWNPGTISGILRNPVYIGKIKWGGRPAVKRMVDGEARVQRPRRALDETALADGLHEPIVSQEVWDGVQRLLSGRTPAAPLPKNLYVANPLAGLVRCARCGRAMVRRPYPAGRGSASLICPTRQCPTVASSLELVEAAVLAVLRELLRNREVELPPRKAADPEAAALEKSVLRAEQGVLALERQLEKAHELLEQEVYTPVVFAARSTAISQSLAAARTALEELREQQARALLQARQETPPLPRTCQAADVYWAAESPQERNQLLGTLVERIIYRKDTGGRGHESGFFLTIFPRHL